MPIPLILPLCMLMALIAYSYIAKFLVLPNLAQKPIEDQMKPLIVIHCFRFVGLFFLIPGVTQGVLDPRFNIPAAYGDLLSALLAFLCLVAIHQKLSIRIALIWVFNIIGTVDLLYAVTQGIRFTEDGTLGTTFIIPALVVPALLVSHAVLFNLLLKSRRLQNTPDFS